MAPIPPKLDPYQAKETSDLNTNLVPAKGAISEVSGVGVNDGIGVLATAGTFFNLMSMSG